METLDNFIKTIKEASFQFAVRQLRKLLGKRHRNLQHINFLQTAKHQRVTPVFYKIRIPKHL